MPALNPNDIEDTRIDDSVPDVETVLFMANQPVPSGEQVATIITVQLIDLTED